MYVCMYVCMYVIDDDFISFLYIFTTISESNKLIFASWHKLLTTLL